jgi:hypothetical protein
MREEEKRAPTAVINFKISPGLCADNLSKPCPSAKMSNVRPQHQFESLISLSQFGSRDMLSILSYGVSTLFMVNGCSLVPGPDFRERLS